MTTSQNANHRPFAPKKEEAFNHQTREQYTGKIVKLIETNQTKHT